MRRRTALAIGLALAGIVAAFSWLWIGPSSYQPCRPAPLWDEVAVWLSQRLGAGETDGPASAPAFCEIPTDLTWLIALGIVLLAFAGSVFTAVGGRNPDLSPLI